MGSRGLELHMLLGANSGCTVTYRDKIDFCMMTVLSNILNSPGLKRLPVDLWGFFA